MNIIRYMSISQPKPPIKLFKKNEEPQYILWKPPGIIRILFGDFYINKNKLISTTPISIDFINKKHIFTLSKKRLF
jgi:hypothetical protein